MGAAVERLTGLVKADDRFDIPYADLLPLQLAAAEERLQSRLGKIKFLDHRVEETGVRAIRSREDIVPLLFAHTTYKSYPESWFYGGKWDRMSKWLDTVATDRAPPIDLNGVDDVDQWLERLEDAGVYVSCSSGTTGKCSMIPANMNDRAFYKEHTVSLLEWVTGVRRGADYLTITMTPVAKSVKAKDGSAALSAAFGPDRHAFPGPPITVGRVSAMVALRRSIADGTAKPGDIARFEEIAAEREQAMKDGIEVTARTIVENRRRPLFFAGMFATMFQIAEMIREMGYSGKDFHPDNLLSVAGGLKGAVLPPDYREYIMETFNLQPRRISQSYGMQELAANMPRCLAGRYHVPPWLMLLPLDAHGEALAPMQDGQVEGRAGFFDIALDGRWNGLITGDKVQVDFGPCACGHQGPTVHNEITRYADLPGGDKITCAGTIDAYVRGVA
jgi:hypothetical protein